MSKRREKTEKKRREPDRIGKNNRILSPKSRDERQVSKREKSRRKGPE